MKKKKCFFATPLAEYLGHMIDQVGLHRTDEYIWVIEGTSSPMNIRELHSFLSLINYYGKFLSQLSTVVALLYTPFKRLQAGLYAHASKRPDICLRKPLHFAF